MDVVIDKTVGGIDGKLGNLIEIHLPHISVDFVATRRRITQIMVCKDGVVLRLLFTDIVTLLRGLLRRVQDKIVIIDDFSMESGDTCGADGD